MLSKMISDKSCLFNTRWECLNLVKEEDEYFVSYVEIVNKMCEQFKLRKLSPDMFKCFVFVQGLMANKVAEIHTQVLTKVEEGEQNLTLQVVGEMFQSIINLQQDVNKIEETHFSQTQTCRPRINKETRMLQPNPLL